MGKHTAGNDDAVDPFVAEALARRSGAPGGAHGEDAVPRDASTGWPGPPPGGGSPVGWPDDARPDREGEPQKAAGSEAGRAVAPAGPPPRRGWRRLFGASSAA